MTELKTLEELWKVENKLRSIERIKQYAYNSTTPNDCYIGRIKGFLKRLTKARTEQELYNTWENITDKSKNNLTFIKCLYITRTNLKYAIQEQETYCIALDTETLKLLGYLIDYNLIDYLDNYNDNLEKGETEQTEKLAITIRDILNLTSDYMKMLESIEEQCNKDRIRLLEQAKQELEEMNGGQQN